MSRKDMDHIGAEALSVTVEFHWQDYLSFVTRMMSQMGVPGSWNKEGPWHRAKVDPDPGSFVSYVPLLFQASDTRGSFAASASPHEITVPIQRCPCRPRSLLSCSLFVRCFKFSQT